MIVEMMTDGAQEPSRHALLFAEAMKQAGTERLLKSTGTSFTGAFDDAEEAVKVALWLQRLLRLEHPAKPLARIGLHAGALPGTDEALTELAGRVVVLASAGQILMTRAVFDPARQTVAGMPEETVAERAVLSWVAHGAYLMKGIDEPVGLYEAGVRGCASFQRPADTLEAARSVSAEEEATLGWRPGLGLEVPRRPGWRLEKRLGEGGFGEVWLAENRQTRDQRVFKFCFDAVRLRSFKREFSLFRLIRDRLGVRQDIATLHEVSLESPPFFLESEYCAGGTLREWLESREVPLPRRLELMAQTARALAAAHSVGVIHKDVKPSNIFVDVRADGTAYPRLADFGVGMLMEGSGRPAMDLPFTAHLTGTSRPGTSLYSAPEYLVGRPPSVQGDIYSLGVLLYQVVIGDFDRPMGAGWRRDVTDAPLAEDIAQCVDVDPARRFASALQVAEHLEAIEARHAEERLAREHEHLEAKHRREMERQRIRQRRTALGLMVAGCVALCAVVVIWVLEGKRSEAVVHGREMEAARREMEQQRNMAQDRFYLASMAGMTEDVLKNRTSATRVTLDKLRPAAGEPDRRGWEWYYADTLLNPGQEQVLASDRQLRAMALSPDERQVAVAGDEGMITLWSTGTLERLGGWEALGGGVNGLAWNSQGLLAAALQDGGVAVWEVAQRHETARWKAHEKATTAVAWHPRLPQLVSGGADGTVAMWKPPASDPERTVPFKGRVQAAAFRPDGGALAVTLTEPCMFFVGKPEDLGKTELTPLNTQAGSPLAWQPNGNNLLMSVNEAPVCIWNNDTRKPSRGLTYGSTPGTSAFVWSATGNEVAVGSIDGSILLAGLRETGGNISLLRGHQGAVAAMYWLKRRDRLLSAGADGTLRAWDEPRRPAETFSLHMPCPITAACWSPTQDRLALVLADDELRVIDPATHHMLWERALPRPANVDSPIHKTSLAWSPDGTKLAAACPGRALSVWDAGSGNRTAPLGKMMAAKAEWMPDGRRLLIKDNEEWMIVDPDGTMQKLDIQPGTEWLAPLAGGQMAALEADGSEVRLHITGAEPPAIDTILPKTSGQILCVAVNKAHDAVAFGTENGTVAWFDSRTKLWSRPAATHAGMVVALAWNGDGSRLVSAGTDLTCRVYSTALADQTWLLTYPMNPDIAGLGWNALGDKLMLAGGVQREVKVYDAARSMDREMGRKHSATDRRLAAACAAVASNPEAEGAWKRLAEFIGDTDASTEGRGLLLAAAKMGEQGLFDKGAAAVEPGARVLDNWQGEPLPAAVKILQCAALGQWTRMAELCATEDKNTGATAWTRTAWAEALSRLGRKAEAEQQWREAWDLKRQECTGEKAGTAPAAGVQPTMSHPSLADWASVMPHDDWTGADQNNLGALPPLVDQKGWSFATGRFIQMAGKTFRATHEHMFPRMTDWMPLGKQAHHVAFMVSVACYSPPGSAPESTEAGTCAGSLYLRRATGGVVRIPLLYGVNVWDWWTPSNDKLPPIPPDRMAWTGSNGRARQLKHSLVLCKVEWEAGAGDETVTDFSIDSTMRKPAPMLLAVEAVR